MIKIETYFDEEKKDIKAYLTKNEKEYYIDTDDAYEIIKYFDNSQLLRFDDDGSDATLSFDNCDFIIKNYEKVLKDDKTKELFIPVFLKINSLLRKQRLAELKKKKIKRIAKYVGAGVVGLGLAAYLLHAGKVKATEVIPEEPEVAEPTVEENDTDNAWEKNYVEAMESLREKAVEAAKRLQEEKVVEEEKIIEVPPVIDKKNTPPVEDNEERVIVQIEDTKEETVDTTSTECFYVDYEDRTTTDKALYTKEKYGALIEKYAKKYGLDPNLVLAVATQESGGKHYDLLDGGPAIGLMQIEKGVWRKGGNMRVFNFESNSWETITITAEGYSDFLHRLRDPEYNIDFACAIIQYNTYYFDYNVLVGLQANNMGMGSVGKVLDNYCYDHGISRKQVLEDQYDTGWMPYRNYISSGDSLYIEHVLSFVDANQISMKKPDGTIITINISKESQKKVHS